MASTNFLELFHETGTTISEWAKAEGFSEQVVYGVVSGRIKGVRGQALEIRETLEKIHAQPKAERINSFRTPIADGSKQMM